MKCMPRLKGKIVYYRQELTFRIIKLGISHLVLILLMKKPKFQVKFLHFVSKIIKFIISLVFIVIN